MADRVIRCPHCQAGLKLKAAPRPGAKLKCPKCQQVFAPASSSGGDDDFLDDLPPAAPSRALPPRTTGKPSASRPAPKKKAAKGGAPVGIILAVVGGVLLLAGAGVGGYFFLQKGNATSTAGGTGTTIAQTDGTATAPKSPPPIGGAFAGKGGTANSAAPAAAVATAGEGGETPEATWDAMMAAQEKFDFATIVRLITPESRRSGIVGMVSMVRSQPVPDRDAKLKAAFEKRGADYGFLAKVPEMPKGPGRGPEPVFNEDVPLNVVDALYDFVTAHAPNMLADRQKGSRGAPVKDKLQEVEIDGDAATGVLVHESLHEGFTTEVGPDGKTMEKKSFSKKMPDRQTMHFKKIAGRWFVDFENNRPHDKRAKTETAAREKQRDNNVQISQNSVRDAYLSFQRAIKGSDWPKVYALLTTAARERWIGNFLANNENDIGQLARDPRPVQQGYPYIGKMKAFLDKHKLDAKQVAEWISSRHSSRSPKPIPDGVKSVPHPEQMFADIMEMMLAGSGSSYVTGEHQNATLLGAQENGDKGVVITRSVQGHEENPYNVKFYAAAKEEGQWRINDEFSPEFFKKRKELAGSLIPSDKKLKKSIPAPPPTEDSSGFIDALALSPDGKMLAAGGYEFKNSVQRWDPATGSPLPAIEAPADTTVAAMQFTSDGKQLVLACNKGAFGPGKCQLAIVDVATGKVSRTIPVPKDPKEPAYSDPHVLHLVLTPSDKIIVGATMGGELMSWDLASGKLLKSVKPDKHKRPDALAIPKDSSKVAVGYGYHNQIHFHDPSSLKETKKLEINARNDRDAGGQSNSVNDLKYSPDGKWLAIGFEHEIQVWDAAGTKLGKRIRLPNNGQRYGNAVQHLCWSPDSRALCSATHDQEIQLWDPSSGNLRTSFLGHWDRLTGLLISADNQNVISSSADGEIRIWQIPAN